jgi:hypothetical protein
LRADIRNVAAVFAEAANRQSSEVANTARGIRPTFSFSK